MTDTFSPSGARLDHIGVAVRDLDRSSALFRALGLDQAGRETVAEQGVELLVLTAGETRIELLRPLSDETPVGRFIARHGEGLHHIALKVTDIREALRSCREAGIRPLDEEPRTGAEGRLIAFLDPGTTSGVLIELVQKM